MGKSSVYRYVESPDFDILLLGFSADGSQVQVVDLAQGEQIPPEIIDALSDERVHKWAFNANFERVCLSEWLRRNSYPLHNEHYSTPDDPCMGYLDPVGWHCTMVWSAYLGLPLSLKDVGAALGLDKQKLTEPALSKCVHTGVQEYRTSGLLDERASCCCFGISAQAFFRACWEYVLHRKDQMRFLRYELPKSNTIQRGQENTVLALPQQGRT